MKKYTGMNLFLAGSLLLGMGASGIAYAKGAKISAVRKNVSVVQQQAKQPVPQPGFGGGRGHRMGDGMRGMPNMTADQLKAFQSQLTKDAKDFGVKTEGKTIYQIQALVAEARIKKEAADLNIKTDGKTMADLQQAVFEARVKKDASEYGISLDGKTLQDAAREIMEKKVLKAAKELGISVELKGAGQVVSEIAQKYPDKLKTYGLDTYGPGARMGMGGGMGRGMGPGMGNGMNPGMDGGMGRGMNRPW